MDEKKYTRKLRHEYNGRESMKRTYLHFASSKVISSHDHLASQALSTLLQGISSRDKTRSLGIVLAGVESSRKAGAAEAWWLRTTGRAERRPQKEQEG